MGHPGASGHKADTLVCSLLSALFLEKRPSLELAQGEGRQIPSPSLCSHLLTSESNVIYKPEATGCFCSEGRDGPTADCPSRSIRRRSMLHAALGTSPVLWLPTDVAATCGLVASSSSGPACHSVATSQAPHPHQGFSLVTSGPPTTALCASHRPDGNRCCWWGAEGRLSGTPGPKKLPREPPTDPACPWAQ